MSPTPNLNDLIRSVRAEVGDDDPAGQLAKAAEYAAELSQLGDSLLDHFVFQCRQAGMSWAELSGTLGVSKQAAHKRFTGLTPSFQRFTLRAREAVQAASEKARELGHPEVGTEHLLLGMFAPAEGLAALTLVQLGLTEESVIAELLRRRPRGESAPEGAIPYSAHAKDALRGALDEALELGHNYIGTEHLLLGLQRDDAYASAAILEALGARKQALRDALVERLYALMAERTKQSSKTEGA